MFSFPRERIANEIPLLPPNPHPVALLALPPLPHSPAPSSLAQGIQSIPCVWAACSEEEMIKQLNV